jgi:hypothetical protein
MSAAIRVTVGLDTPCTHTYQVAIDVPGFGQSAAAPLDGFVSARLLMEVIQSLGKEHAYAIVAAGAAAAPLFACLLKVHSPHHPLLYTAGSDPATRFCIQLYTPAISCHLPPHTTRNTPLRSDPTSSLLVRPDHLSWSQ